MKEFTYIDQFDQQRNGELSDTEEQIFQQQLKEDDQFAEEYAIYQDIMGAIDLENDALLKLELQGIRKELELEAKPKTEIKKAAINPSYKKYWWATAASIALLLSAIGFSNFQYSNNQLSQLATHKLGFESSIRKNATNADIFATGHQALRAKEYATAIAFFEGIPSTSKNYLAARLRLAFAQYFAKDYENVIANTQLIIDASSQDKNNEEKEILRWDAEWLQVQSLLAVNQTKTTDFTKLLQEIATNNNHTFQAEAIKLQQDLNSFWRTFIF